MKFFSALLFLTVLSGCAAAGFSVKDSVMTGTFRVKDASGVAFYSSADGYTRREAVKNGGKWTVTVPESRRFTYYLEKDGEIFVPDCPMKEQDDFGGVLCVYEEE
ncbi:hypothetical protein [Seleniivibrio woodruffii]|uniref:Lipoprotein n=1 Tax=Seleniivibrio woodruffii TaxID=1078050 RepID=A0A4R1KCQ2_9BACT|nr:hypothetical protein [Seleniivibrio woodruffii]TCK62388.1 hypothetical protein C8D98_0914 [Seleniivibrio woodruffii]TVZ34494.1 hypothetical protein OF66_0079 [Seleniivibrio woodruffii]